MYEVGYEHRIIDVTYIFENYFGVKPLYNYYWDGNIGKDPSTGYYYTYEAAYQAGDKAGWSYIGSSFEEAVKRIESTKRK